ncbi:MAG: glycosyltransferase family 2 protein [Candidatus Binatia bacterium]
MSDGPEKDGALSDGPEKEGALSDDPEKEGALSDGPEKERALAAVSPAVAIVPLFDGEAFVGSCLDALLSSGDDQLRVVVVDDGSRDGGAALAREIAARSGGRVEVLGMDRNRGFAAAVNRGAAWALAQPLPPRVLVMVNQDCRVAAGFLGPLVEALAEPGVAIAGARLLEADGVTLQHAGACIQANGLTSHLGRGCRDGGAWRESRDADYVCGALMAVRASTWRSLGALDEGYAPAYYEEVDLCWRARRAGWRVVLAPDSIAVHAEASTSGAGSRLYLRRYHRNRLRFVVRCLLGEAGPRRWLGAELSWLLTLQRWRDLAPVLAAYARAPLFAAEMLLERRRRTARHAAGATTGAAVKGLS